MPTPSSLSQGPAANARGLARLPECDFGAQAAARPYTQVLRYVRPDQDRGAYPAGGGHHDRRARPACVPLSDLRRRGEDLRRRRCAGGLPARRVRAHRGQLVRDRARARAARERSPRVPAAEGEDGRSPRRTARVFRGARSGAARAHARRGGVLRRGPGEGRARARLRRLCRRRSRLHGRVLPAGDDRGRARRALAQLRLHHGDVRGPADEARRSGGLRGALRARAPSERCVRFARAGRLRPPGRGRRDQLRGADGRAARGRRALRHGQGTAERGRAGGLRRAPGRALPARHVQGRRARRSGAARLESSTTPRSRATTWSPTPPVMPSSGRTRSISTADG